MMGDEAVVPPVVAPTEDDNDYAVVTTIDGREVELDAALVELLKNSKDRTVLLKLDVELEKFLKTDDIDKLDMPPMNAHTKEIVQRAAEYFGLDVSVDSAKNSLSLLKSSTSQIPEVRFHEIVNPADANKPMKIMQRSRHAASASSAAPVSQTPVVTTSEPPPPLNSPSLIVPMSDTSAIVAAAPPLTPSVASEEENYQPTSDDTLEQSDSSSRLQSSSPPPSDKNAGRPPLTIEEREEAYNRARARIFSSPTTAASTSATMPVITSPSPGLSRSGSTTPEPLASQFDNAFGYSYGDVGPPQKHIPLFMPALTQPTQPSYIPSSVYIPSSTYTHPSSGLLPQQQQPVQTRRYSQMTGPPIVNPVARLPLQDWIDPMTDNVHMYSGAAGSIPSGYPVAPSFSYTPGMPQVGQNPPTSTTFTPSFISQQPNTSSTGNEPSWSYGRDTFGREIPPPPPRNNQWMEPQGLNGSSGANWARPPWPSSTTAGANILDSSRQQPNRPWLGGPRNQYEYMQPTQNNLPYFNSAQGFAPTGMPFIPSMMPSMTPLELSEHIRRPIPRNKELFDPNKVPASKATQSDADKTGDSIRSTQEDGEEYGRYVLEVVGDGLLETEAVLAPVRRFGASIRVIPASASVERTIVLAVFQSESSMKEALSQPPHPLYRLRVLNGSFQN